MHLTLVHDWLTGLRGGEKCLDLLCRRFPQAELLTLLHRRGSTTPAIERMPIRASFLQHIPGIQQHYRWSLPLMPLAIESLAVKRTTDLVLSFSHAVAKGVIAPRDVPHVCYCFTPMRYAWHLRDEYFSPNERRRTLVDRARDAVLDRLRDWDRAAAERVTRFVAISRTIAERIRECYGRESTIIYPPVDTEFYTPADNDRPRDDYYLCVSALVPYKRLDHAIAACVRTGRRLVIIGTGPERARLEQLGQGCVQFLGWQSDEVIRDHLRRCRALLFPGHEDFGIVPVEAQACGAPVIALAQGGATETVLPASETAHGSGVLYEQPTIAGLSDALDWFEAHAEQCDPQLAREQAEQFTVARYEQSLVALLAEYCPHVGHASRVPAATTANDLSLVGV
ncbi:MAG: glycosyltransferase [Planctomycetaceae bacterium]|nr:glycosyltransferase [Planctomycetaceae bacterium]